MSKIIRDKKLSPMIKTKLFKKKKLAREVKKHPNTGYFIDETGMGRQFKKAPAKGLEPSTINLKG